MSPASRLEARRSGVYRTPASVSDLWAQAGQSGAACVEVNLANVRGKAALMHELARALALPPHFGMNWDALSDSLQDLAWKPANGYVLHLQHGQNAKQALGAEWHTLLEILRESAAYWKSRGKPFVAIIDGAPELPSWA